MKKYKTVDVDYSGCHPVIAEALKQGKHIWCYYPSDKNRKQYCIIGYNHTKPHYTFMDKEGTPRTNNLLPVEVVCKFKSAAEIIQWCVDHGWVPAEDDRFIFRESYKDCGFVAQGLETHLIKFYAGKVYNPNEINGMYINFEWLEEVG